MLEHLRWESAQLIGYSLRGSLAVNFASEHQNSVRSLFLIAPAGMVEVPNSFSADDILEIQREPDEEDKSRRRIWEWLEGSPTVNVPSNWKGQVNRGVVVAPALRQWQLDHHAGHIGSVASYMRNGCVFGSQRAFEKVAQSNTPIMAVLGELDDMCTAEQLDRVGIHSYNIIPEATHGLARENVSEVVDFCCQISRQSE